jgi:hypothetical protein
MVCRGKDYGKLYTERKLWRHCALRESYGHNMQGHEILRIEWRERKLEGWCKQGENCGYVVHREKTLSE